ncbi:MAG: ATP-binding cassette domain-containing protein [Xanthomonadales bacterium]|jgi:ATP-binding cassette subfamily F protein 3|nr:ATP-binding cassette domain-containing protein [Xanthomonadales bacterium]
MLSLSQVALRRGRQLLFEDASLQVHRGQRLGVIGRNGCGKSSLFALIRGELETDRGEVTLPRGCVIASVRQETPASDRSAMDTVIDGDPELRELLDRMRELEASGRTDALQPLLERLEEIDGFTAETRAGKLLHGLGFAPDDAERPVSEFSGGWRMRLNLAQALMCRSDLLLLDEPTNHLDLPAILWLERWLKHYDGMALIISHDRDFLDDLCTHIAHIEQGRLTTYTGDYSQFEAVRAERLALQQALFERQQKEVAHIQKYVDRFRYKASKAKQAQSRLKMLERMERIAPAHVDSEFHFSFRDPERQPPVLIDLNGATLGYEAPVLENVRLQVQAGDRIGLLGVNGAGKSTLVKALADGSTLLDGDRGLHQYTKIGYFAQHQLDQLNEVESARWHVERTDGSLTEQEARNFLGRFGFAGERADEPVAPFSGGEKARLVLALLVLQRPNLLLLDEPTNHLDLDMRQALSMALMDYEGALVVIAHDRHLLRSVCEDLFIVHDGQLEHFEDDIDHYPAWLRAREKAAASTDSEATEEHANAPAHGRDARKAARRDSAERRARLRPLERKVQRIERDLAKRREDLDAVEQELGDESLYGADGDAKRLQQLLERQATLREVVDAGEWSWLEASELLEKAQAEFEKR